MSELENLFSAAVPTSDHGKKGTAPGPVAPKSEKVQLVNFSSLDQLMHFCLFCYLTWTIFINSDSFFYFSCMSLWS